MHPAAHLPHCKQDNNWLRVDRTDAPLSHLADVSVAVCLRGAPEEGPHGVGGGPGREVGQRGHGAEVPREGDGVGGHGGAAAGGCGRGRVVSEVRDGDEVLAGGLLVDAAAVLGALVAVAEHVLARLARPGAVDGDAGRGGRGRGGGGCCRRSCGGCCCGCCGDGLRNNLAIKSWIQEENKVKR